MNDLETIYAFDFDGVLLNSINEVGIAAWKTLIEWDGSFLASLQSQTQETESCNSNNSRYGSLDEWLRDFAVIRPRLETGYESVLMLRMLHTKMSTPEEILNCSNFLQLRESALSKFQIKQADLIDLYAQIRKEWISSDLSGWLACQSFYPGVLSALEKVSNSALRRKVFIITTKQKSFVEKLFEQTNVPFPSNNIFGLESGPKVHVLEALLKGKYTPDFVPKQVWFIEDRLKTLLEIHSKIPNGLSLTFADWGFVTTQDIIQAKEHDHIRVFALNELCQFIISNIK